MELTELVSTQVALPVLGVLFCALLVFAFGFKSPGQPPSFDVFTEDNKKKRQKKTKKNQSNGHAVTSGDVSDGSMSGSSNKPQASPRSGTKQTTVVKQAPAKQQSPKPKQTPIVEPKKQRKQAVKDEEAKVEVVAEETSSEGWLTISKGKKKLVEEKTANKENVSPQGKKAEKKAKKGQSVDTTMDNKVAAADEKTASAIAENVQKQEEADVEVSKKKAKTKKEKKPPLSPTRAAAAEETGSKQTEAPAKQEIITEPPVQKPAEEEEFKIVKSPKKKAKKEANNEVPSVEPSKKPESASKKAEKADSLRKNEAQSKKSDSAKRAGAQSKKAEKEAEEASGKAGTEGPGEQAAASLTADKASLPNTTSSAGDATSAGGSPKKTKVKEVKTEPVTDSGDGAKGETSAGPSVAEAPAASFDELPEDWTEAKPKKQKKKARREN